MSIYKHAKYCYGLMLYPDGNHSNTCLSYNFYKTIILKTLA